MRLRQVALVANDLQSSRNVFFKLLGLDADFLDPGVGDFGLDNSVMAIGDTFLEVVVPNREGTTAGRLLERRRGDGGYMVLVQVDDIEVYRERTERLGIRKVWNTDRPEVAAFHVHPKDIGAAIVSFDQMNPPAEWEWGGPNWRQRKARHVSHISAVDIQGSEPEPLAARWAETFDRSAKRDGDGWVIELDEGRVNVRPVTDGRGEGVSGVEFVVSDRAAIERAAKDLGLTFQSSGLLVCGTWCRFIDASMEHAA